MQCFAATTTSEVRSIILKCPHKSCDLDTFPICLLKRYIEQIIYHITTIIDMSMQDGVVSDYFKQALVNPLIKNKI